MFQETHRDILTGQFVTSKCFDSALSIVLGNAKDWQSERRKRIVGRALSTNRIKRPHRQEESETGGEL